MTKALRRLTIGFALGYSAACGPSNSAVQDEGTTLAPHSEAMATASFFGLFAITEVLVTDQPNICADVPAGPSCSMSASGDAMLSGVPFTTGHILGIAALASQPGTFPIATATDGGGLLSSLAVSTLEYISVVNGEDAGVDTAVSGSVTFSSLKSGGSAAGNYDVTMSSGSHLSGSFNANDCAALDKLFTDISAGPECSSSSSSSTCSRSCTCQGVSAKASCDLGADGGGWQCRCTSASGQGSVCTMSSSLSSSDVCGQGTSCCPFTL